MKYSIKSVVHKADKLESQRTINFDKDSQNIIIGESGSINTLYPKASQSQLNSSLPKITSFKTPVRKLTGNTNYFCPCCDHCNNTEDLKLEEHLFAIRDARNILHKAFEYVIHNINIDKNTMMIFSPSSEDNEKDNIEHFINNYTKTLVTTNRQTYQILAHFLTSLIDDKISMSQIVSPELEDQINKTLISQGLAFAETPDDVIFDEELEKLFDGKTKEMIKTLFRSMLTLI